MNDILKELQEKELDKNTAFEKEQLIEEYKKYLEKMDYYQIQQIKYSHSFELGAR